MPTLWNIRCGQIGRGFGVLSCVCGAHSGGDACREKIPHLGDLRLLVGVPQQFIWRHFWRVDALNGTQSRTNAVVRTPCNPPFSASCSTKRRLPLSTTVGLRRKVAVRTSSQAGSSVVCDMFYLVYSTNSAPRRNLACFRRRLRPPEPTSPTILQLALSLTSHPDFLSLPFLVFSAFLIVPLRNRRVPLRTLFPQRRGGGG